MNVRELYSNNLLIVSAALIILGLGNWIVGAVETTKYQGLIYKTAQTGLEESYRSFRQLDQQKNEELLLRITQDRERFNAARAKLNFFYVVLTGGRIMFLIGALMTLWRLIVLIRRDTKSKMTKILQGAARPG